MCGRLAINHPTEAMARLFGAALANDLPQWPNFNLCPTQTVAVITGGAARHARAMRWGEIDTVAVVTTQAGPNIAHIHNREPVMLEAADWPLWLGEAGLGAARLMQATAQIMQSHRVASEVNSNRASGAHLINPIPA